jgi:monothiol glutaredoxin
MTEIQTTIDADIKSNPVILYMKGTAEAPECGFSSVVVQILKGLNVPFKAVNVLVDPEVRKGIKEYSKWPTIPQLYIKGEFIGGCDIVREMYQSGEFEQNLKNQGIL